MTLHVKIGDGDYMQNKARLNRIVADAAIDAVAQNGFEVGSPAQVTVKSTDFIRAKRYFLCEAVVEWDESWEQVI